MRIKSNPMPQFFSSASVISSASVSRVTAVGSLALIGALVLSTGCSSKKYVRSQTAPIVAQTNELDAKTAQDHRAIADTDERSQAGISGEMGAANTADQHALAAGQSADAAGKNAQTAYNRVDSLTGVVANLDTYKPLADVSVTFAVNKAVLTADDKAQLDQLATTINTARGYILELTGGTDTTGSAEYNYALSQRRADTVANYLQTKYNIPPRKFYLVGIGKDQQVATDKTAAGRKQNRRVQIRLLSNMGAGQAPAAGTGTTPSGS